MNRRSIISFVLMWVVAFQAIAGVLPTACAHETTTRSAQAAVASVHVHHGGHSVGHTMPAQANSSSSCDCGCACMDHCVHSGQFASITALVIAPLAAATRTADGGAAGQRLSSHTIPLLRPPATV